MAATRTRPTGRAKLSYSELAAILRDEPLIGTTQGAKVLGIKPPNFRRDAVPHLTSVPVEGSADVYFKGEVEEFRDRRDQAKAARAASNGNGSVAS